MMQRLKRCYYQSGQVLLNILKQKIKNLKINNNDYIQYINELNNLFEQYQTECENLNKKFNIGKRKKYVYIAKSTI